MAISQRDQLHQQRTYAAYAALGSISAAICFCRQNRSKDALAVLARALKEYEDADQKLYEFTTQSFAPTQGENHAAVNAA